MKSVLAGAVLVALANAQGGPWAQCGGDPWTGVTTCVSGYYCKFVNQWYSQCLPGTATGVTTTASRTTTSSSRTTTPVTTTSRTTTPVTTTTRVTTTLSTTRISTTSSTTTTMSTTSKTTTSAAPAGTGLTWLGVNESGAEFGQNVIPGVWGTHFTFPANSAIDTLVAQGYNMFRVPFMMERLAPGGVGSALNAAYLANLTASVNYITSKGAWAVLDPHNFGRYNGAIITDVAAFGTFWTNVANVFKTNSKIVFDTNNEYHDMDQTLVFNLNQVAINSIRAAGATSQYIFVEGNSWSGAWVWTQYNDGLKNLVDSSNKLIYEMHQYLDSDGSGTSDVCVSGTIGAERVASATAWLKANGKQGILGEFAGGANSQCMSAVKGLLDHVKANSDVWKGALWWGGGPWWGTYIFGFEPPSGTGYNYYNQALLAYKP